jgi:hypothetical protein
LLRYGTDFHVRVAAHQRAVVCRQRELIFDKMKNSPATATRGAVFLPKNAEPNSTPCKFRPSLTFEAKPQIFNSKKTNWLKMNLKLLRSALWLLFLPFFQTATAQCDYTLEMLDDFGDGWTGGTLTITNGSTVYTFTLSDFPNDDGSDSTVTFSVTTGEPLELSWEQGAFNFESSFKLYDYFGNLVFEDIDPPAGVLFSGTAFCPDCLKPKNVVNENIYDTYARLRWSPGNGVSPALGWQVIYGPKGFVPGPGVGDSVFVTVPKATITGLSKKTDYDYYVVEVCDTNEVSILSGPHSFQTYWSDDVGITDVLTPQSGCDLGVETITVVMSNFGAKPQSLVPFRFSVNGVDGGVPQPQDGFYTGVLGKDSSTVIEFETTYNFSAPGEYLITVYTQMSGDEDSANDTFNYYIVNRLITPYFQNFETWSGGWYVDTSSLLPSWEFGTPNKPVISAAASGQNAWVTDLEEPHNTFEMSYLNSPCFDFSNLTEDPVFQFSLNRAISEEFDGLYLEISVDGGAWDKVGELGEGFNWYNFTNTFTGLGDVWSGNSEGWETARIRLFGMAGESNVRFRFVFNSSFFENDGVGVDDIRIYVPLSNDLAGVSANSAGDDNQCGLENDEVTFSFINFGTVPQSGFQVSYSVNGGTPVAETVNATVQPDETFTYTFTVPFDSRDGVFDIKCWTSLLGEQNATNDTASYSVSHLAKPVPFQEDFESLNIPADWAIEGFPFVTSGNGNISNVLALNVWSLEPTFSYELPRYGIISATDTFSFDYRITNFDDGEPTVLALGTKFDVQISTDCDNYETVYSINSLNHVPASDLQTIKIGLEDYAGQAIKIRLRGTWTGGDFYFDLDNLNLRACPPDMQLYPTVVPSSNGQNGEATVNVGLGNPPFSYLWDTGDTTQTITGLAIGAYKVTVTDDLGCTDELTINVGAVSTNDIEGLTSLSLLPNPTTGFAQFNAVFDRAVDANLQIINLLGQMVWETNASNATILSEQIDLTHFPDGLYLIRLTVDGQVVTKKLVKSE